MTTGDMTTGDGDGDGDMTTGDGDGDMTTGDGDGDPTTGDGDGDMTTGDGDGDMTTGDGDGDMTTGDGDGDPDPGMAMLRVVHLGVDAQPVDIYLDDAVDPAVTNAAFQDGTDYLVIPAGPHTVSITPAGDPDTVVLTTNPIDFADGVKYSAAAIDYLANLTVLPTVDDDAGIDPANVRLQVAHAAPDVGQVDIWALTDPPVLLLENVDFGAVGDVDVPAADYVIGIDVDDDQAPDLTFDVPNLGGGNFVDVYAVNEAGGAPVFLLAHLPDGSTARIDPHVCGNDIIEYGEVCDGAELNGETCETLDPNYEGGTLGCLADCSDYDFGMCTIADIVICNNTPLPIPDNNLQGVISSIDVPNMGNVASVRISVDITHTWLADLDVSLNKDGNNSTFMFQDINNIGQGVGSCSGNNMLATLDDTAATSIQTQACTNANVPAVNGTHSPQQPLANFAGQAAAGTWNLRLADDAGADVGTLNSWCVYITPG